MNLESRMSGNSEAADYTTDRSDDGHPHRIENSDLCEDDIGRFQFLESRKGDSSSLIGSQHIKALEQTLGLIDFILQPTNCETMSVNDCCVSPEEDSEFLSSDEKRPKSFLHDEMHEFNQIFSELVSTPQRKFPCREPSFLYGGTRSSVLSKESTGKLSDFDSVSKSAVHNDENLRRLLRVKSAPLGFDVRESNVVSSSGNNETCSEDLSRMDHNNCDDHASSSQSRDADGTISDEDEKTSKEAQPSSQQLEDGCSSSVISDDASAVTKEQAKDLSTVNDFKPDCTNCEKAKPYEPMNEEDADSGYQTGDSSVPAMVSAAKKLEGAASSSRDDLLRRIEKFNSNKLGLAISLRPDSNIYEGNVRVHLNIYRPIKMSLSSRPSSIYDILIRTDARLPESEPSVAFFRLPSNTFKAIHISSETTTSTVIKTLLTKFNITDNPKRFALYERILPNEDAKKDLEDTPQLSNTLSFVRRLADDDRPLELCLLWADHGLELLDRSQFVLQENDPGEIMWEDFSLPELNNFLRILSKEERCYADQIRTKYRLLRREIEKRLQRFESERKAT